MAADKNQFNTWIILDQAQHLHQNDEWLISTNIFLNSLTIFSTEFGAEICIRDRLEVQLYLQAHAYGACWLPMNSLQALALQVKLCVAVGADKTFGTQLWAQKWKVC